MPWVDDSLDKLKSLVKDAGRPDYNQTFQLYEFNCSKCGYHAIRAVDRLQCGCGMWLNGFLVFKKVMGTVIFDKRFKK